MRARRLAAILTLTLALDGPGVGGWVLFAQQSEEVSYDAGTNKLSVAQAYSPVSAPKALQAINAAAASGRITQEEAQRTRVLIERYGTSTPEVEAALTQLSHDLDNPNKDAKLTLSDLYDRMSPAARKDDAVATYVSVISQTSGSQNVAVKSSKTGATLFYQSSVDLAPLKSRRVITRPDPSDPSKKVIEAVIIVEEKGSAEEQKVLYNRKVHLLLKNLKRLYYDQCSVVRKINNGANPPVFKSESCKLNGKYQIGFNDPDLKPETIAALRKNYAEKQMKFDQQTFKLKDGRTMNLRQYLDMIDAAVANGTTDKLNWEDLEAAQRMAMKFYGENQLSMMQNYVLIQLQSYFAQVTGSQAPKKKEGQEGLDPGSQDAAENQRILTEIEKGHLEGYGLLMTKVFKVTELSHEDQKYITPELMLAAGEAFAYVSYAVKARERAFDPKSSGEEVDAAIEEGQQWLKLAQIQLQTFEMNSLSIQMERLRDGQLRDHIGLSTDDAAGHAEATRLANVARTQYLPRLREASQETKRLLLKQSVGSFWISLQNAARAQLYSDTLRDRLRALAARALEMRSLYLAGEFEKVKDRPEYKGRTALDNLQGGAYKTFLDTLQARSPAVWQLAADLDKYARQLLDLSGKQNPDAAIREAMRHKLEEFKALAARLGFGDMPDVVKTKEEAERSQIKQAQFFAALQEHATKMRVFDMLNELDQYLKRYASSDMPDSDGATVWDKIVSFKWMDWAINKVTFGGREGAIDLGMKNFPLTKEAFKKLGGEAKDKRQRILSLMAQGKYEQAYKEMQGLDPDGAKRALDEWKSDQLEKDPFEEMDMIGFMSKPAENLDSVQAQAVVGGLFGQLQTYILGYTGMAAAFDAVFMTIATAGMGQLAKGFVAAGRATVGIARAMEAARAAKVVDELTKVQKVINLLNRIPVLNRIIGIARWAVNYTGRVMIAWGRNFRNTLELKAVATTGQAVRQFLVTAIPNAARSTVRNMAVMGVVSGGMQYGMYAINPNTSQYKNGWQAFGQGALGGAKFGASAGLLMIMTPVPATALGNGLAGRVMTGLAESPGPISGTISTVAKAIPKTSTSLVARAGVWGGASEAALAASPAMRAAVNTLVWGGAMVDGALKYYLAAEIPKEVAESGHFAVDSILHKFGMGTQGGDGATAYVNSLASANHFGLSVSQVSWILIPVNSMHSLSDVKEQKEQFYGFTKLVREGRAEEIMERPNGEDVRYERSFLHRAFNDPVSSMFKGEGKTGTLKVNEQFKEMANRMTSKSRPISELAALSTVNGEVLSGRQKLSTLMSIMEGKGAQPPPSTKPTATAKPVETAATPTAQGKVPSRVVVEINRVLDIKAADGAAPKKIYAYFSKAGSLMRASTEGNGKSGVKVELEVKADGSVDLARTNGKLTKINEAALKSLGGAGALKMSGVITEFNGARTLVTAAPTTTVPVEAPKTAAATTVVDAALTGKMGPDEIFVTNEGLGAWRKLMEQHLAKDTAMRRELLTNRSESVELRDPETKRTFTVSGESLKKLREMAGWQELNRPAQGVLGTVGAVFEVLKPSLMKEMPRRVWRIMTGQPVETPAEMVVRDIQVGIESDLKSSRSPKGRAASISEQLQELRRNSTGADADALAKVIDVLDGSGKPQARLEAARGELAKLSGGASPDLLLRVKRSLAQDAAPETVAAGALKLLEGAEGPAAESLRAKLGGKDAKQGIKDAVAELGHVTSGAPLETLASFERAIDGRATAGDLIHFARTRMDARIEGSSKYEATALTDLRRTIESDAFVKLANDRMVDAVYKFRSGGRGESDRAELREAVDLLVDTWERGVFGQAFKVRVEKNGEMVWDIPDQYRFKDANGNTIPSFRQGQLDAIRDDLFTIAEGKHMIYNLLQTSGGKTLLSFVLVGYLEAFAKSRGKEGAIVATANADLVSQGLEAYKAFFKGRKPSFEIMTYSDLMVKQAMADEQGSLGPFDTHDVVMDEFDMVGMGTPLSLGKFMGQMSFSAIDPVQTRLREGVNEAWDKLFAKYGEGQRSMTQQDFERLRKINPAFDAEFRDLVARTTKQVREALVSLDPMVSSEMLNPSYKRFRREFIQSIPEEYAKERGMTREELYVEMVREHRHAFGGFFKVGVLEAKYGSLDAWVEKVVEGGFEAASVADPSKAWMKDPQREGIIQFHNDQALDSLDTHYRTSLELRENVPVTLDFENLAVTDFRKINLAAKDAGAVTIALSGTLPDGMRPFLKSIGVETVGKGSDPNKAANIPQEILAPRPELLTQLEGALKGGKKIDLSVGINGVVEGVGRAKTAESISVPVEARDGGRLVLAASMPKEVLSKMTPDALEHVGLALDQLNASRVANPEGTPFQLAAAREGIVRLLEDARFKGTRNIAYVWVESLKKMDLLLKDLDSHGITLERTSILTSPGSNFFLQERYMYKIKTEKNIESVKAGEVDVVVLAGQGGLRGLEAPLQAYAGGEIKMFVTDSYSLADVSLVQLLGRIDRGRVPTTSKTTFALLDDAGTVLADRGYRETAPRTVLDAASGLEQVKIAQLEKMMGRQLSPELITELFVDPKLIEAKNLYRDILTLQRVREAVGPEELAKIQALPEGERKAAAAKLMERPDIMKILVVELRRGAEQEALRSSGIYGRQPTLWQQFLIDAGLIKQR